MKFYLACLVALCVFYGAYGAKGTSSPTPVASTVGVHGSIKPSPSSKDPKPSPTATSNANISNPNMTSPNVTISPSVTISPNMTTSPNMTSSPNMTTNPSMTTSGNTTSTPVPSNHTAGLTSKPPNPSQSPTMPSPKPTKSRGKGDDDDDYDSMKKRMWVAGAFAIILAITTILLGYLYYRQRKINRELNGDPAASRLL